jgi:spermidine synthase
MTGHWRGKALIARELIGRAQVPGGDELKLYRHDRDFMILLGRNELMSSRMSGSEVALATQTCTRIAATTEPSVLIGGYGMGFTLRAALGLLGCDAQVTVAELVPEIIEWARGPMQELAEGCLDDLRVNLIVADVADVIANGASQYDAIMLDVDNGPDGLVRAANNRIYSQRGLQAAKAALRPGGVLSIWSAAKDAAFVARLKAAGFQVEEVGVRARSNGKGPRHVIWFATVM